MPPGRAGTKHLHRNYLPTSLSPHSHYQPTMTRVSSSNTSTAIATICCSCSGKIGAVVSETSMHGGEEIHGVHAPSNCHRHIRDANHTSQTLRSPSPKQQQFQRCKAEGMLLLPPKTDEPTAGAAESDMGCSCQALVKDMSRSAKSLNRTECAINRPL